MAEVVPMEIDCANERELKFDGPVQKKKQTKRKRSDPSLYTGSSEEKQAKIKALRNEINSLVRFGKELVLENRGALLENVNSSTSLNCVIAYLMEESDLPLSKLVDVIYEKVKGRSGNGENYTKAIVKSTVLMIGQRMYYGITSADADLLEDEAECALWRWETRNLKVLPKLARLSVKVRRTCWKKILERITTVFGVINALEKSEDNPNCLQELAKASKKLGKVPNEADIRLLIENMSEKNGAEIAEKEAKKEEKLLIKQMEKNKQEMERERKKMDRELQKEKLQNEKELKRLHDEAEKEERRREKEEHDIQKQLRRQQEEAEKDKRRKEKEEALLKKQLALQKQASLMEQFLKRKKTTSSSQHDSSLEKEITSKLSSDMVERKSETVAVHMDSVLAQSVGIEAEAIWRSHINLWHCIGQSSRSNRKVHWGARQKPKTELVKELNLTNSELTCFEDPDLEKLVGGCLDSNIDGSLSQMNMDGPLPSCQKRIQSKQLLQFDKSHRPAFYGIWPKKSKVIGARRPFAKDPDIDYEINSDEEWEEEEPGESLSDCDKDDEDENVEAHLKGDDEDASEDGFFVPDGYLSQNEGVKADEMDSDEVAQKVRNLPDYENQVQSEDFCTLLRQQKYLNNLTEDALKKNQPLIILNLMHEKTPLTPAEELTGIETVEQMFLRTLQICPLPDSANIEISTRNDVINDDLEASSIKLSTTPPPMVATVPDSDLLQIISVIRSCPHSIGKIVESLHNKFPALSKSQLRNKVREISDFSDNHWQVKKAILSKIGLPISPDKNRVKSKSIATFFSKRCMPPSTTTINLTESPPQPSQKFEAISRQQQDCSSRHD